MISLEKFKILSPTQKLPKTVGDLGKLILALKSCPKSNKSPNLVTLSAQHNYLARGYLIKNNSTIGQLFQLDQTFLTLSIRKVHYLVHRFLEVINK